MGLRLVVIGAALTIAGVLHLTGHSTLMVFAGVVAVVAGAVLLGVKHLGGNR